MQYDDSSNGHHHSLPESRPKGRDVNEAARGLHTTGKGAPGLLFKEINTWAEAGFSISFIVTGWFCEVGGCGKKEAVWRLLSTGGCRAWFLIKLWKSMSCHNQQQ